MSIDTQTLFYALAGGIIPTLLWLWFWLKEDEKKPEPRGLIILSFIAGMIVVVVALPLEKISINFFEEQKTLLFVWASIEEVLKYLAIVLVAFSSRFFDEPIDAVIYMITVALGFSALENTLYLIEPIKNGEMLVGFLNGNLRFLGATLLHVVSSASIGIAIAFSFYKNKFIKIISSIIGLVTAIVLHSLFNFFIMEERVDTFLVFALTWLAVVFVIFLFEKIKKIKKT